MSSRSDSRTNYINKLCKRLEDQIDQPSDAAQQQITVNLESNSDDKQEIVISTTTSEALLASLQIVGTDGDYGTNKPPP